MATTHIVKQDEHLSGIAARFGFADFHIVLDHPNNAALRAKRDPHVLFPGDKVFIPDRVEKVEQGPTTQVNTFEVAEPPLFLRLRLHDLDDKALAKAPFELLLESKDQPDSKTTDAQGILLHEISKLVKNGELTVQHTLPALKKGAPGQVETLKFDLKIGRLNPETTLSGQQARLNNLGYFAGFALEDLDQLLWAIEEFQCDHMGKKPVTKTPVIKPESADPADVTGVQDKPTRDKIRDVHGI